MHYSSMFWYIFQAMQLGTGHPNVLVALPRSSCGQISEPSRSGEYSIAKTEMLMDMLSMYASNPLQRMCDTVPRKEPHANLVLQILSAK